MDQERKNDQRAFLEQYFLSTKEAINQLDVSQQTFYEWIKKYKIEKIDLNGTILYFKEDVDWLK